VRRLFSNIAIFFLICIISSCGLSQISNSEDDVTTSPYPTLSISGVDISEFSIVYAKSCLNDEDELALLLANHIMDNFGVQLQVCDDSGDASKHMIHIGRTGHLSESMRVSAISLPGYKVNHANSMLYTAEGHLWVICNGQFNTKAAINKLITDITPTADAAVNIDYSAGLNVQVEELGEEMRVMSYNVQTGNANSITSRVANVRKNIINYDADIVGAQEVNYIWLEELNKLGFFETYTRIGEAREGEKRAAGNEYSCIFYKTDKFNLIDSGTYWLSDTPERISKLPDCDYYRVMTYGVFERKSDGVKFIHVNTHLEWNHGEVKTNLLQINVLLDLTDSLLAKHGDLPVFFTGDFNEQPTSEGYARMLEWGTNDARNIAESSTTNKTFSGGTIIDYCFVSEDDFAVTSFKITKGNSGSDHYPVYVRFHLINK